MALHNLLQDGERHGMGQLVRGADAVAQAAGAPKIEKIITGTVLLFSLRSLSWMVVFTCAIFMMWGHALKSISERGVPREGVIQMLASFVVVST